MKKNNAKFTVISLIIIAAICFVVWVVENNAGSDIPTADQNTQQSQ